MEKKEVRKMIREEKKKFSLEEKKEKSLTVWSQIEQCSRFQDASIVLAYWSMDDEVFTHDFVRKWAERKTILLPCVNGDELDIRYYEGEDRLSPGEGYAIPEPIGALFTELAMIDVVLVPGIAFDKQHNRLGRGKGYYDKILKETDAYKIGICFDFQMLDKVPTDDLDVQMNELIVSLK